MPRYLLAPGFNCVRCPRYPYMEVSGICNSPYIGWNYIGEPLR